MKKDITELYCFIADFCTKLSSHAKHSQIGAGQVITRKPAMDICEILTIVIMFHKSPCKNFKYFYNSYLQLYKQEFPTLLSYNRFVELKPRSLSYFVALMYSLLSQDSLVHFIDSTMLPVCHNKRIYSHKVFDGFAAIGKSSMGWFYGLKLHLVVNSKGQIAWFQLTSGNVSDSKVAGKITKQLKGLLIGDKWYISSKLFKQLFNRGLKLITGIRKNMKNKLMTLHEKILLRKRSISETVNDYLKNKMSICHTRHRSPINAIVHIISTMVAYSLNPRKPSITMNNLIPN